MSDHEIDLEGLYLRTHNEDGEEFYTEAHEYLPERAVYCIAEEDEYGDPIYEETVWPEIPKGKRGKKKEKPTHDELGRPLKPVILAPQHFADWKLRYSEFPTEEAFVRHICNNDTILNQKKQGNLPHYPCHDLTESIWGEVKKGWTEKPYLLVLPSPVVEETANGLGLAAANRVSWFIRSELEQAGIPVEECMVTYACRFGLPVGTKSYNAGHKASCGVYVQADARAVKPKVIITFGTDALKSLLGPKTKLATFRGNVENFEGVPIVPTQTPNEFMTGYGGIEVFRSEITRARMIRMTPGWQQSTVDTSGYRVVETVEQMRQLVGDIQAANPRHLSFDYEFGSLTKREEHQIQRSCQVCWGAGKAAFIKLRGVGGVPVHSMEDYDTLIQLLGELLRGPWRLDGQHLRVDVNECWKLGIPIDDRLETGFCTMLVYHLLHGDDDIGLDQLCRRYTPEFGAYWRDLELWLDANGRKKMLQYGYLHVPDEILIPYGLYDADVTWRCAEVLEEELRAEPELWDLYWQVSAPTNLHIMDMERHGILVDEEKRMELRAIIEPEYRAILAEFRQMANWPEFDQAKSWQIASYLYSGTAYKDKKPLPPGVVGLGLQPPFNTDKYPQPWDDIEAKGDNHLHSPSTKAVAIDLLIQQNPEREELRYLKFMSVLGKFLNTYLSRREQDLETGMQKPGKSFAANIWEDGRVRTHIAQTSETGRWRSFAPNLQCNPKKQETSLLEAFVYRRMGGMPVDEYIRRTDDKKSPADLIPKDQRIYLPSFKEVYIPSPGNAFMEVDFKTAEICVWAYCSGDKRLIRMIEQKRDIHCETATHCFNLPVRDELEAALKELDAGDNSRYKAWEKNVKKTYEALRTVAKAILFGLIYGRGAAALSREINKQGVETTIEECQKTIDGIAKAYPQGWDWLIASQKEAIECGYVKNAFGFKRYFSGASLLGKTEQAKIKRQGPNAKIQGTVAQLLCRSGMGLYRFRYRTEIGRKLKFFPVLPIHDAYLIEFPVENFEQVKNVVRVCMSRNNLIPGTEYSLGVDFPGYPMKTAADH